MQVYEQSTDTYLDELLSVKIDITEEQSIVQEGVLTNIKDTLLKWLEWIKNKLVEVFKFIRTIFDKMCKFFITKIKSVKKHVKEWYDKHKKDKDDTTKESAMIVTESGNEAEYELSRLPGNVTDGFEHAHFKSGILEPFISITDKIYKNAVQFKSDDIKDLSSVVDNLPRRDNYYMLEVLGSNALVKTHMYDESYCEKLLNKAKSICDDIVKVIAGKFNSYINQLDNKIKSSSDLTKDQSSVVKTYISLLSKVSTAFKDNMGKIYRYYGNAVYNCRVSNEKWHMIVGAKRLVDKNYGK